MLSRVARQATQPGAMMQSSIWHRLGSRAPFKADSESRFIFLMLVPAVVLLFGLTVVPFLTSVWLSLTDYLLTDPPARFIGLGNYVELFTSADFWKALWTSLVFTVAAVALESAIGICIAVVLHGETRLIGFLRTVYLVPLAITPVAALFTFRMMLNPGLGVVNYLLRQVGIPAQDWLGSHSMALMSLILVDAWQWTPFMFLIIVGGLASLSQEPFEAAELDGASTLQIFFYITLPLLKPYLYIAALFRSIDAFKTFDLIYVLTAGGPGTATTTVNLYGYKQAIEFLSLGRGAAIAIIIMIIMAIYANVLLRRTALDKNAGGGG
jgi:multiple sugar transport system permease protein